MNYVSEKLISIYQDMERHNISIKDLNSKSVLALRLKELQKVKEHEFSDQNIQEINLIRNHDEHINQISPQHVRF